MSEINKAKVTLMSFVHATETGSRHEFSYSVEHNNGTTSLEQTLVIQGLDHLFSPRWVASIKFDEFPPQQSPELAALKLAEWMERLAAAIRSGKFAEYIDSNFLDCQPQSNGE